MRGVLPCAFARDSMAANEVPPTPPTSIAFTHEPAQSTRNVAADARAGLFAMIGTGERA